MKRMGVVAVVAGVLVVGSWTGSPARYGGPAVAQAQDSAPTQDKGVKAMGLVSSTGGFAAQVAVPMALTGQRVDIEPGGTTARQRFLVPAFVYVLDGTLTANSEGGPVGVNGVQYYAAGQAVVLPPPGTWFYFYNNGQAPLTYLVLFIAPPGATTVQKAPAQ